MARVPRTFIQKPICQRWARTVSRLSLFSKKFNKNILTMHEERSETSLWLISHRWMDWMGKRRATRTQGLSLRMHNDREVAQDIKEAATCLE